MNEIANIEEIKAEAKMNPDMVVPAEIKEAVVAEQVKDVEVLSTNIVDHLMAKAVICPADVSSHGLTKKFWQELCEFMGCTYTSRLKDNAKIVLVTPKDNSPKFERATKAGMNCVEYKVAVADLMATEEEVVKNFLAGNAEWQKMLANEADKKAKAEAKAAEKAAKAEALKELETKAEVNSKGEEVAVVDVTAEPAAENTEANENVV